MQPAKAPKPAISGATDSKTVSLTVMLAKLAAQSILLFDPDLAWVVRGTPPGRDFRFVFVARIVVIIALVLRHGNVIEDDAHQVAAGFFNQLFGANIHRLRITAVLDDLDGHVHFA